MQCPACHTPLDEDTIFCGNCGRQIRPLHTQGATHDFHTGEATEVARYVRVEQTVRPTIEVSVPHGKNRPFSLSTPETPGLPVPGHTSQPLPERQPRIPARRLRILVAVLLLVLAGGAGLTLTLQSLRGGTKSLAANAHGQILFFDSAKAVGNTDALKITVTDLQTPPTGAHYNAWLINEQAEQTTALGTLTGTASTFTLNFASNGTNGQPGTNLLNLGNKVIITLEQGQVRLPTGPVMLSSTFPPLAFIHIKHLLFSFPTTPGQIGLLVGLLEQTKLLNGQTQILQSIAANQDPVAQKCAAQSILDIIEGQAGSHYQSLPEVCGSATTTGDGFGILGTNGYIATTAAHASLAATQTDTTPVIRQHADEVEAITPALKNKITTIQQDALRLLNSPTDTTPIREIATLATQVYLGVDANGNGQVEPRPTEAGATTAYLRGQLMATLAL
ncbi:MAG TPA: zinc ribbon domain-containing protein [Ktedonobacteraceae bacterium]|nr:zinc ribbon domain-containing protein [Ktedonobacteraceae bacterium]